MVLCGAPNLKGLSAKRRALKIELSSFLSKRFALCAMRYALFSAENTGQRKIAIYEIEFKYI